MCCDPNADSTRNTCPGNLACVSCGIGANGRLLECSCPGGSLVFVGTTPYWSPDSDTERQPQLAQTLQTWDASTTQAPKVVVLLLTEAGCPPCMRAIAGPLSALVAAPGVADIIDLQNHPFGNNYYTTEECGGAPYDTAVRHCWAKNCVESPGSLPDCFTGDIVTQHGPMEGAVNRMLTCAKAHSSGWQGYWPFLVCMEREYTAQGGLPAVQGCAQEARLNYDELDACYLGSDGDKLMVAEAKATVDHEGTPTVKVNGKEVDAENVLAEVCAAYTGTKPPGCPSAGPSYQRRLLQV